MNTTADTVDADIGDGICADANGDCSLRAASQEANHTPGPDIIHLQGGETYTLTIPGNFEEDSVTGDIDLRAPTTINTNGTGQATINAGGLNDPAIHISQPVGGATTLTNLNITGSNSSAAVYIDSATETVNIDNSRIHNNTTRGIQHFAGALNVTNTTIDNNIAGGFGAAILTSGDLVDLVQVTIADNIGVGQIANGNTSPTITTDSSTITGDTRAFDLENSGSTTITSSVIDTTGNDCLLSTSTVTSGGNNVASDTSCGLTGPGDLQGSAGNVKPLADNGGPAPTQLPNLFSSAHDQYPCAAGGSDARGLPRNDGLCDKGAVEAQPGEATGVDCLPTPNIVAGADLAGCDISGGTYNGTSLTGADLTLANINNSQLFQADLSFAVLDDATVTNSNFREANLDGVSAIGVDFTNSFLGDATTNGASFTNATWNNTTCPDFTNSNNNGGTCDGHL